MLTLLCMASGLCSAATAARPGYEPAGAASTARVGPRFQCAPGQHQNEPPKQPKGLVGWYYCRSGQPHRWPAFVYSRTRDQGCPYCLGRRVCPCNSLAHNFPEVAAEWDREANGLQSPELVAANSHEGAVWRCNTCDDRWRTTVSTRTGLGRGCPQCADKSCCIKERRPSIAVGAAYLTEWDHEANNKHDWHPDNVTLGSQKQVHWVCKRECNLGVYHKFKWQQTPHVAKRGHHSPLAKLSVLATPWLYSAQMQLLCETIRQMEAQPLTMWPSSLPGLCAGRVFKVVEHIKRQHMKMQQSELNMLCFSLL